MTTTEATPTAEPLADLIFDLFELEAAAAQAIEENRGTVVFLHDKQDVLVVTEHQFPQAFDYILKGWKLLAGSPLKLNFRCGPAWAIPINPGDYIGDLEQLGYDCLGIEVSHGKSIGQNSPADVIRASSATDKEAGNHARCDKCSGVLFAVPCVVCEYVWSDGVRQR